jgi:predicted transcriptional regulator
MRTITLDLTDRLHKQVQELANKNNISVDLFVAAALADKVSTLLTEEHLAKQRQKKHGSQI